MLKALKVKKQNVTDLTKGSVDMHVHANPHPLREVNNDAIELARQARSAGMKAMVIKCNWFPTSGSAYLINKIVENFHVFGGIVLNNTVGGMNVNAIKSIIPYGDGTKGRYSKMVWMPTFSSCANVKYDKRPSTDSVPVVVNGKLVPGVEEILNLIAENNIVLATGHISSDEALPLVAEAKRKGVRKILVTHPDNIVPNISVDDQKEMANMGAYIEYCFCQCTPYYTAKYNHSVSPKQIVEEIKQIGAERCVMSTDFGADPGTNAPPIVGMQMYIGAMLELGITMEEVEIMIKRNPSRLLDLE
jgi:hypothetical protein